MLCFFASVLALAALRPVLAGVYVTSPVATSPATGGQVLTVTWADDGDTPSVASVGPCSIDLYTGGSTQQTWLQNFAASVDVSKAASVSATIDPTLGQSGAYYFLRFSSLSLKSSTNPAYPYEAFSAIFSISSMTGTFNSTVLAQLDGGSVAAVPSSMNATSPAAEATVANANAKTIASTTTHATGSAKASSTSTSGARGKYAASGVVVAIVGGAVALSI